MNKKLKGSIIRLVRVITSISILVQLIFAPIVSIPNRVYADVYVPDSFEISVTPYDNSRPEPVTNLTALSVSTRLNEGLIRLSWTAPREDSFPITSRNPVGGYYIRFATYSILSLNGDTTAWWDSAYEFEWADGGKPGDTIIPYPDRDLIPGVTYYFAIKSYDNDKDAKHTAPDAVTSLIDTRAQSIIDQVKVLGIETDFAPETPKGLTVLETTTYYAKLQWIELTPEERTEDFDFYRIYRSTTGLETEFTPLTDKITTTYYIDSTVLINTTYYYRISAVDKPPLILESPLSYTVTCYISVPIISDTIPPEPITDLTAVSTGKEAEIKVSWTAPADTGGSGLKEYHIKADPTSVLLSGNTTYWWNNAELSFTVLASTSSGNKQEYTFKYLDGIVPGVTYYFGITAVDNAGNESLIDIKTVSLISQASAYAYDARPGAPSAVTALEIKVSSVTLTWTHTQAQQTLDFDYYIIYRSSSELSGYYQVGISKTLIYIDTTVVANKTYYYRVSAIDKPPLILESPLSYPPLRVDTPRTETIPPREPYGIDVTVNNNKVTIKWIEVRYNADGTVCDDLSYYKIYRSTSITDGYVCISTTTTNTFTDTLTQLETGKVYYYYITAVDMSENESYHSAIADTLENVTFTGFDNTIYTSIPKNINDLSTRGLIMEFIRKYDEEQGRIIQSYEFKVYKATSVIRNENGEFISGEEFTPYQFSKVKTELMIRYKVVNNEIVTFGVSGINNSITNIPADQADKMLSIFYYNGIRWINLGGEVDIKSRTVKTKINNVGKYQLRQVLKSSEFSQEANSPYPKIITPNNDGKNDKVFFFFNNTTNELPFGRIYDITGGYVNDIKVLSINQAEWNGTDYSGRVVPAGVYIYQVECAGKVINGTIVVAK